MVHLRIKRHRATQGHIKMQDAPMTREEIAEHLKVSTMTISRYIKQGMPHLRAPEGGRVLFDSDDVVSWLKCHGNTPVEVAQ